MSLVLQLGEMAVRSRGALPDDVRASVRQRVLDVLGLCAAAAPLETSRAAMAVVEDQGGRPQAHVVKGGRTSAAWAAFGNGVLAHSLDYDDTHLPSVLHPSASVVPAALAAAEQHGADGEQLLHAVAVGIEVCVRVGMAGYDPVAGNSLFFEHGQHATSICGALGAAAAAALLDPAATAETVAHSVGLAVSMGSGVIEANRTGGTVKRMHCGWAAHSGVVAASLAGKGITAAPTSLEGRFGFFQAWLHREGRLDAVTDGLGQTWCAPGIFFKPYPANHFTHTAVDAARRLAANGLRPEDVASAHLAVASPTVRTIGEPLEVKQAPETGYQAQFSGPYAVVVGLLGGGGLGAALSDYTDELAQAQQRRALMARVTVGSDPRCDAIYPHQFPAILTVTKVDGSTVEAAVMVNRGGPGDPLSEEELVRKFIDNASRSLGSAAVDAVQRAVRDLGPGSDVRALMALTA